MKNFSRAMKLYTKPVIGLLGILMSMPMVILLILLVADPCPAGSEDYTSMLFSLSTGHIGVVITLMACSWQAHQNKFYPSTVCAKELYVYAPILSGFLAMAAYDLMVVMIAGIRLGSAEVFDILPINSISTAMFLIASSCYAKPKMHVYFIIFYFVGLLFSTSFRNLENLSFLTEFSMETAILFSVGMYLFGIVCSLILGCIWWKNCDKFSVAKPFAFQK